MIQSGGFCAGLIDNIGTRIQTLETDKDKYALKSEIKELPTDLVNQSTLTNKLSEYALKSDIKELPTDLVNESKLTTKLGDYRTNNDILYKIAEKCEIHSDGAVYNTDSLDGYHIVGDYTFNSISHHFDIIFKNEKKIYYLGSFFYLSYLTTDEDAGELYLGYFNDTVQHLCGINLFYEDGGNAMKINLSLVEKVEIYSEFALKNEIKDLTTTIKYIPFERLNDIAYKTDKYVNGMRIVGKAVLDNAEKSFDFVFMEYHNGSNIRHSSDIPELSEVKMRFSYEGYYKVYIINIECSYTVSSLTIESITYEDTDKIVLMNDLENYVAKEGDATINGSLTITTENNIDFNHIAHILAPNITDNQVVTLQIRKERDTNKAIILSYKEPGTGTLSLYNKVDSIIFTDSSVTLNKPTTVTGNLTVTGTITETQSNTTITHYCPISESNSINDFIIGAPVYLTGEVFKYESDQFVKSTADDTTDCICSVKTQGTWKEYVGIYVRIDSQKNCITFASGGDYMVAVDGSSCYGIGDEVFIDNEDNKLKILTGQTAITSKIRRMTVGIITGIVDNKTLAVFK